MPTSASSSLTSRTRSPPRQRIFERLYRVDQTRDRATGGVGLGLAIASRAAHSLGGRTELESTPGRGSEFRLIVSLDRGMSIVTIKTSKRPSRTLGRSITVGPLVVRTVLGSANPLRQSPHPRRPSAHTGAGRRTRRPRPPAPAEESTARRAARPPPQGPAPRRSRLEHHQARGATVRWGLPSSCGRTSKGFVLSDKRRLRPPYVSPASGTAPASLVDVSRDVSPFHSTPAATVASRSFSDGLKAPRLAARRAPASGQRVRTSSDGPARLATATAYPELGERRPDLHGSKWRQEETSATRLRNPARAPPRRPDHFLGHASQLPNGVACGGATGFMRPTRHRILW